jgi:hypothetical protein
MVLTSFSVVDNLSTVQIAEPVHLFFLLLPAPACIFNRTIFSYTSLPSVNGSVIRLFYTNLISTSPFVRIVNPCLKGDDCKSSPAAIFRGTLRADRTKYDSFIRKYAYRIDGKVAERCIEAITSAT